MYYGWVVVAVAILGIVTSAPGQTMGVGPFTESLMEALGLTRMQISAGYAIGSIISGFLMTPGGRLIDRYGVRATAVAVSIAFGFSLIVLAYSGGIAAALSDAMGITAVAAVSMPVAIVSFLFLRFMGQGMMSMAGRVMIGKWFDRRRGLAMGISGMCISFGFGMSQVFFNFLIELAGWQTAYLIIAAIVGIGMSAVAFVFYREQPEDFGLEKDGTVGATSKGGGPLAPRKILRDFTLREASRSYTFWVFTAALASQGFIVTAVTFHIVSVATEAGITKEYAFWLNLPLSLVLVLTNLFFGWLSDRTKLKYILAFMMIVQSAGTFALIALDSIAGQAIFVAGFGISGGLFGLLLGSALPRFFGLAHLGAISGLNMSLLVILSALGPPLFAFAYGAFGSYHSGYWICGALPLLIAVLALKADNPQTGGL